MTSSDRLNAIPPYPFVEMEKSISEKKKEGVVIFTILDLASLIVLISLNNFYITLIEVSFIKLNLRSIF